MCGYGKHVKKISLLLALVLCTNMVMGGSYFPAALAISQDEQALDKEATPADMPDGQKEPPLETDGPLPSPKEENRSEEGGATVLVAELAAEPEITLSQLCGDGVELSSLNSDVKIISGALTIGNGQTQDWYYQSMTGEKNALYNLNFDGSFHDSKIIDLSVDSSNPATVHFSFEVGNKPLNMEGAIHVLAAQNCFGKDLTVTVPVNLLSINGSIAVDDPKAKSPSYTITGNIEGGSLAKGLEVSDLALDGAFAQAKIDSITAAKGSSSFTVKLSKPAASQAMNNHGKLTIAANTTQYNNGAVCTSPFSIELTDNYTAPKEEKPEEAKTKYSIGLFGDIGKETTLTVIELVAECSRVIKKDERLSMLMGGNVFASAFSIFLPSETAEMKEQLDVISGKIDKLSLQLEKSEQRIINNVNVKSAIAEYKDVIDKFGEKTDDLYQRYYEHYNEEIAQAFEKMKDGKELSIAQLKALPSVYSSENNNHAYLDDFVRFSKTITGNGSGIRRGDIFKVNQDLDSYVFNWSTQTFGQRKKFNEMVYNYHVAGYVTLTIAIQYDHARNMQVVNEYSKWLEIARKEESSGRSEEGAVLSKEYLVELTKIKKDAEQQMEYHVRNAEKASRTLSTLSDLNVVVKNAYDEAMNKLKTEESEYAAGKIYSYRLGRPVSQKLLGNSNVSDFERGYSGATDYNDVMFLYYAALDRGNQLYAELVDAGFTKLKRKVSYIWTGAPSKRKSTRYGLFYMGSKSVTTLEVIQIVDNKVIKDLQIAFSDYPSFGESKREESWDGFVCINVNNKVFD